MAKVIAEYVAVCRDVAPISEEKAARWGRWRKDFIGRQGRLIVAENSSYHSGRFLHFSSAEWSEERQDVDEWRIETSSGQATLIDNLLVFKTRNSCYIFDLKEDIGTKPKIGTLDDLIEAAVPLVVKEEAEVFLDLDPSLIDPTGAILTPGRPDLCEGNGEDPRYEICCDNCDYYLDCFPEAASKEE